MSIECRVWGNYTCLCQLLKQLRHRVGCNGWHGVLNTLARPPQLSFYQQPHRENKETAHPLLLLLLLVDTLS